MDGGGGSGGAGAGGSAGVDGGAGTGGTAGIDGGAGAGGTAGTGGNDGGSGATGVLLALAGGKTELFGAELDAPGGTWSTTKLTGTTPDAPALTVTSGALGVGLVRSTSADQLLYTTWSSGTWSAPAAVAAVDTTRGRPAIDADGTTAQGVFQGNDYKYYYSAFTGTVWTPNAEVVQPLGAPQSYGPMPAAIAARGGDATVAFFDGANSNRITTQDRAAVGGWSKSAQLETDESYVTLPALVRMTAGPELMVAYARQSDAAVLYATRSSGSWSSPATIPSALAAAPVALAALPGGRALLAFHGTDDKLYTALYMNGSWVNAAPLTNPNVSVVGSPAVARGVGGDSAELAYIGSDGAAHHSRLVGGSWTAPVSIGGANLAGVALAVAP